MKKTVLFLALLMVGLGVKESYGVGRNHPDRYRGRVTFERAKKPYAYCPKGYIVRIKGALTEVSGKNLYYSPKGVTLECRKLKDAWKKTSKKTTCPPLTSWRRKENRRGRDICAAPAPAPANIGVTAGGCGGVGYRYKVVKGKRDKCQKLKLIQTNVRPKIK